MFLGATMLLLGSTCSAAPAGADFGGVRPALPGSGPDSLVERTDCPPGDVAEHTVVVFCETEVLEDGRTRRPYCFRGARDGARRHVRAATRGLEDAVFESAVVDGREVHVYTKLRVVFVHDEAQCRVHALPNWGVNGAAFGLDYIAPQEIQEGGSWFARAKRRIGRDRRGGLGGAGSAMFVASVLVHEDGSASDARLERNVIELQRFEAEALRALGTARFVPGFHEGRPVAMRFQATLHLVDRRRP